MERGKRERDTDIERCSGREGRAEKEGMWWRGVKD
jgi:hypothetical protein